VILFWFTKDTERAGIPFSNLLNFIEVHDEHLVELVFRMFRLNKLRLKALSVQQNFDFNDFETLRSDVERGIELLKLFKPKAE
jgi:hypothetical protein